ncbi:MAG: hypothetical protein V3U60_11070 [Gammaproteobacteria bacterium]
MASESVLQKREEAKWRAEQDLRTLKEAKEIVNDSNRLKRAKKMAAEQIKALAEVSA